ncbi:ACR3 family arsenite efflux transporter [Luteimonas rhizosphaericola]
MGPFERGLSLWVLVCIVVGTAAGWLLPGAFSAMGRMKLASVNLPVAVLVWLMIVPMLLKVDFASMGKVGRQWRGIGVTLGVNWLFKPFLMALLAWLFLRVLFARWLPADQVDAYVAGLILLGAAPCTAMVFVWSHLSGGDPEFTLSQVALNDTVMVVAFAPIVALLLGISAIRVPWDTLLLSVAIYILIPLAAAVWLRRALLRRGGAPALERTLERLGPWSIGALLGTLVLLFGFQGGQILRQPLMIVLLAVPILVQAYLTFGVGYWLNRRFGTPHCIGGPSALIGASNFFELAVATAIVLFGVESGAALATVVGVVVEVPVMLSLVRVVNASRGWYEARG